MSSILAANTAIIAGEITFVPEGEGPKKLDALSADVIGKGLLCWHDYGNATAGDRGYKLCGTTNAENGPYAVTINKKVAGETKITAVGSGFEVTVTAGDAIAGGAEVKPSKTTTGRVDQFDLTPTTGDQATGKHHLKVGKYVRLAKYANSGDGNNAIGAAAAGDIIVIRLY